MRSTLGFPRRFPVTTRIVAALAILTVSVSAATALQKLGQVAVGANPSVISFNPGDGLAYVNGPGGIIKVNGNSLQTQGSIAQGAVNALAIDTATNTLFVADFWNFRVIPVDLATGASGAPIPTPGCHPFSLASSPGSGVLYVAGTVTGQSQPGCLLALDTAAGATIGALALPSQGDVALDTSTGVVYVADFDRPVLVVIRGGPNAMIVGAEVPIGSQPRGVAVNPLTHRVYVGGFSGSVWVVDALIDSVITSIPAGNVPFRLAVRPSVNRIYVTILNQATMKVIDGVTNTIIASGPTGVSPHGIAVDDVGGLIFTADDQSGTVSVFQDIPSSAPTSTTVASSNNPSTFGQAVTFTATVTSSGTAPSGSVTFRDGALALGTGTLDGLGQTTFTTSALSTGSHSITAFYSGSSNFSASTSPALTQTVTNGDACGTFQAGANYGTGTAPVYVVVGDFNGDGKQDLASANVVSENVSILLGSGDGAFQAALSYATGRGPSSVAVGDFNADGAQDLAVSNRSDGTVSVLIGNGAGVFQSAVNYFTGSSPVSVAVGDFNGDGKQDLAVANSDFVSILLGNGDGTFQPRVTYSTGGGLHFVAVGDFDRDGKLDLAVANNGTGSVQVLMGNGDGSFQSPVSYATGSQAQFVAIGDFNGDGREDLAVANTGAGNVSILLGNGNGTFGSVVNFTTGATPASIALGDFNGDGRQDLAVGNVASSTFSVLLGNGDGTFQASVNYAQARPESLASGDFNGDGKPDLAVANSNSIAIWLGSCPSPCVPATTDDGNPCTVDTCNTLTGVVTHIPGNAGTQCRAGNGVCDPAEVCDGSNAGCPNDAKASTATSCDDSNACTTADQCDGSGACAGGPALNVDDGNPCTVDSCNFSSGAVHTPGNAGTECRASAGGCDVAETCTGSNSACPADSSLPNGTACTDDGDACSADVCTNGSCTHDVDSQCASCVGNTPPVVAVPTASPAGPIALGGQVQITADFIDTPGRTHTCSIAWDDATSDSGVVTESDGSGSCSGFHGYTAAGVYTVTVTVSDTCSPAMSGSNYYQFVVIYDPNGGFVTGGGWINSAAGSYAADPTLTGRANFGFVSKYRKGANTPDGETEFQFQVADFNFHSTAYEWLVIAGAKAQYKGSGTVNNAGNYRFLLTATDGDPDRFRIKIWDPTSNVIVYDNTLGSPDDMDAADPQVIGGGSIVVHKK